MVSSAKALILSSGWIFCAAVCLSAQESGAPTPPVRVDEEGVMRWAGSGDEVALFGVNYATPFAHGYRAHNLVGADHKASIDADVLHFSRLGLDAFRIHVWDREITDVQGNLMENHHLDLLDYLLARLSEHGIRAILTPIAWWPAGYPEPDPGTHGLSDRFSKGEMTVDPEARRGQENYLRQFVAHRNPYTGLTYGEDPNLIALEVFNEPDHPGGPEETTTYIDAMVEALRGAGFEKPIFYNISQGYGEEHGRAVCSARIDGVSHQWYPSGLVRNGAVGANMLPNVDRYTVPYQGFAECGNKARMVYEFDAADVDGSYMYPAMARSFREAGFQWATQFAYDPLAIAHANTEYQTHFLNLAYTPGKAVSFMIAGVAFRELPRGETYGTYPSSERFGSFRVSYMEDLSEMVADTVFLYSNDTPTSPPAPEALRHVAGVGSSPVVSYDGTGAYFLDRLGEGLWRLEVFPDAVWAVDPFTRPSLDREAARVLWRTRTMGIRLPDLGPDFLTEPLDGGNTHQPSVRGGVLDVRPGVYLLSRTPGTSRPPAGATFRGHPLGAFAAPPSSEAPGVVLHDPPMEAPVGRPLEVEAEVALPAPPDSVALFVRRVGGGRMRRFPMESAGAFGFRAEVPAEMLQEGKLEYAIAVYGKGEARTFPGGDRGDPYRWDFTGREVWEVLVVAPEAPILLFDAKQDLGHLLYPNPFGYVSFRTDVVAGSEPGRLALSVTVEDFSPPPHHFALRTFLPPGRRTRLGESFSGGLLRIKARAVPGGSGSPMEIALVETDGTAWGAQVGLSEDWEDVEVPLSALRRIPLALLPRPYPEFLPYWFEAAIARQGPRITEVEGLQLSLSHGALREGEVEGGQGFEVERVVLEIHR